jgi:hypothetical protein
VAKAQGRRFEGIGIVVHDQNRDRQGIGDFVLHALTSYKSGAIAPEPARVLHKESLFAEEEIYMLQASKGNPRNVRQLLSDFAQSEPLSGEVRRMVRSQAVTQVLYRAYSARARA